jgi:hypothetical protein
MPATLRGVKSKRGGPAHGPASSERGTTPALPVWKAFVVQFSRETRTQTGEFSGRVEHMRSGRRARFASTRELLSVLQTLLDELGETGT